MFLWILVFAPAITALVLAIMPARRSYLNLTPIVPLILFARLVMEIGPINDGDVWREAFMWSASLNLELSFVLDGLSNLFALIVTGIGALIAYYTAGYFNDPAERRRFLVYLMIFMSAMLGIVMSGNFLGLFIFWELTTISSYLLIGFKHDNVEARIGARKALIVTGGGGLALLGGIALIGVMSGGTYDFAALDAMRESLINHHLFDAALMLIIVGAFAKSAQYPFHFWLPGAMEAPTPASSYLHSATMVKAGVYLLARLSHTFGDTDLWLYSLVVIGLFTFVYAAFMALTETDLKAILAYSTVSWLGVLVALIGLNTKDSLKAAMVGILAHALYKGALFLVVGSVDHETGTRDIDSLGGLTRKMPYTAAAATLVLLSMGGIPPMLGFVAKETLKMASLAGDVPSWLTTLYPVAAVLGSAFTVAAAVVIGRTTFSGKAPPQGYVKPVHEAPLSMWSGPMVLGALSLIIALFVGPLAEPVIGPAVSATAGKAVDVHLKLIPPLDEPAFQLSMLAIIIGIVVGLAGHFIRRGTQSLPLLNPTAVYDGLFSRGDSADTQPARRSLLDWGFWLVDGFIQDGRLRYYIAFLSFGFISIVWAAIGYALVEGSLEFPDIGEELGNATILETFIAIIAMFAAVQTTLAKRRLAAVVWAGITGTQTAMLFVLFGAPDLAFTELLIEVLSLILMMLAFRLLPRYMQNKSRYEAARTIRDIVIAASVGLTMTVVTLLVSANRQLPSIRTWFEDNAYKLGRGENIVNVILVDFRGIDTLGEVTVLVIAALGVLSLISPMPLLDLLDRPEDETIEDDVHEGPYTEHRHDDEPIVSHIYGRVAVILRRQAIRSGTVKKTTED